MITIDAIFDAYINANILLTLVFGFWLCARLLLRSAGLLHAYTIQLRLLNGVFLAIIVSPAFLLIFNLLSDYGGGASGFSINFSDMVVAQYLQGNFDMKPAQLEEFLGLRGRFTNELLGLSSSLGIIVMGFIAAGVIIFATRFALSVCGLCKIIDQSHVWRRFGNLRLLLSDTITVPFSTRSLTKRYVVIPSSMLTNSHDLRIALDHEFQHMRQFDLEWEIALEILRPLFFWNPVYYLWKRQVEQLRELSCDQRVLARKGYDAKEYCSVLLHVCQNSLEKGRLLSVTLPKVALIQMDRSLFGRNSALFLRQRIDSLLEGNKKANPRSAYLALMIPLLAFVALSTVAIQKPDDWSQDRIMLSTIINLERLAVHNGSGQSFVLNQ